MTINFTYQQPKEIWSKSGCAENKWIIVDLQKKTIEKFTSCFVAQNDDIVILKRDCIKIYQHFINSGFTDITKKY